MPCSACTDCSCALVVSRLERDMSPKPLVLILPIVSCVQSYLHEYWFLNKFLANGRKNMEKRGNKFFIHDCIYFLQHFCIFLQLMSIFSNPPPIFPQLFLSSAVWSAFFTQHTRTSRVNVEIGQC